MTAKKDDPTVGAATALRLRAEEAFLAKGVLPQARQEALLPEVSQQDLHELRVHQIELEMQNEELRLAQEALDISRARYFDLYDLAPVGYVTIDEKGMIREANLTAAALLGTARGALVKSPFSRFILTGDQDAYYLRRKALLETGERQSWDIRMLKPDGSPFWANLTATAVPAEGGTPNIRVVLTDIAKRKGAEAALERLGTAIEQAGESIVITDVNGTILFVNPAFEATTGYSRLAAIGQNPRILKSGKHDEAFYRAMWETLSTGRTWKGRLVNRRKDGTLRTEDSTISPVRDAGGAIVNYVAVKRDVTEQLHLEENLRQAQKMESVGRLAGGIAHDFNNILTAINGYADLVMRALPEGDPNRDDIKEIITSSTRATKLTRQLLAFSRKQVLDPQIMDIQTAIDAAMGMLKRLIGENIKIETRLPAQPCLVKFDAGQLDQVLLNLALNARDAMSEGGTLTFSAEAMATTADFAARHPGMTRSLVCLTVRDTGCGMTAEVKSHLFEPFFTTKEKGKGTGLGLSMTYGIIKQSGAEIEVESTPGAGTTFRIYFPRILETAPQEAAPEKSASLRGNETVLLVDDEEIIRQLGTRILAPNGYKVLTAADGQEALKVLEKHGRPVDALLTDMAMPGMSGRDLALAVAAKGQAHRTIYISGYTDDRLSKEGALEPGITFIAKPFTADSLLHKLRQVLDGPASQAHA